MEAFDLQEKETLHRLADSIVNAGANVLLCQKGIADPVQFYLAKAGILAVEDVPENDMKNAARALGASVVNKAEDDFRRSLESPTLWKNRTKSTSSGFRAARTRRPSPFSSGAAPTTSSRNSSVP